MRYHCLIPVNGNGFFKKMAIHVSNFYTSISSTKLLAITLKSRQFCLFRMIRQFSKRQTVKSLLFLSRSEILLLEATVTVVDTTNIRVK